MLSPNMGTQNRFQRSGKEILEWMDHGKLSDDLGTKDEVIKNHIKKSSSRTIDRETMRDTSTWKENGSYTIQYRWWAYDKWTSQGRKGRIC